MKVFRKPICFGDQRLPYNSYSNCNDLFFGQPTAVASQVKAVESSMWRQFRYERQEFHLMKVNMMVINKMMVVLVVYMMIIFWFLTCCETERWVCWRDRVLSWIQMLSHRFGLTWVSFCGHLGDIDTDGGIHIDGNIDGNVDGNVREREFLLLLIL